MASEQLRLPTKCGARSDLWRRFNSVQGFLNWANRESPFGAISDRREKTGCFGCHHLTLITSRTRPPTGRLFVARASILTQTISSHSP
jgi:hypothetical protein